MLPSISINNTSAVYTESINENNNDEVNGLVQEFKNLFNGKEGISTCIKHLLELIKMPYEETAILRELISIIPQLLISILAPMIQTILLLVSITKNQ